MTREQLLSEVRRLRARQGENRPSPCDADAEEKVSRAVRKELSTTVEFIFDLDVVEARGLNISDTGIAFVVDQPPPVELRFRQGDEDHQYKAELVRTQSDPKGGFLMGLRFAGKLELPPLPEPPDDDSPAIII